MTIQSQVKRAPESPGSWVYRVVAGTVEAVQNLVAEIESGPNVAGSIFCPILQCDEGGFEAYGIVMSRLYVIERWG